MVSPSLTNQNMPHRMSNLDLESMKQATIASQKELKPIEIVESLSNTVVTHS